MGKKHFITFGDQNFKKQLERLRAESVNTGWFDSVVIETLDTIQAFYNQHKDFIESNSRGCGYWIWKPYVILRQLREIQDGDYLFYVDSGATLLQHRRDQFNQYVNIMENSDTPIITFAIHDYYERTLQKKASLRRFQLESNEDFLNSGQVESGIVMCKKTPFVMKFMEEWLTHMLMNNYELAHDHDCEEGEGYRHDQSVLSILCKINNTNILSGANAYGMGPFFSSRMVDSGQRFKGPDLFRMLVGYNSEDAKHGTYDSWTRDSNFIHYFNVPNIGDFSAKFDIETKTLIDSQLISDLKPNLNFDNNCVVIKQDYTGVNYTDDKKSEWNFTDAIPVIGTAVVNSAKWVTRLVDSVDFPVENFVIVNNNGKGLLREELDALSKIAHPYIKNIHVVHMPTNAGVSTSWNLIIKWFMNSPYWMITNDDVAFGPGLLQEFYDNVNQNPTVGLIHANEGDYSTGSWDLFLIRDFIVQKFGLFDENLYPAYNEDVDYMLRFIHNPIQKIMSLESKYLHGDGDSSEYLKHGSQTAKSDPDLKLKLIQVNATNYEYMFKKWGPHWRTQCPYEAGPFNGYPLSYTTYDLDFVRKKHLGF